jgi:hypothetical protein
MSSTRRIGWLFSKKTGPGLSVALALFVIGRLSQSAFGRRSLGDYGLAGRVRYGQIPMLRADSNPPQIKAQ